MDDDLTGFVRLMTFMTFIFILLIFCFNFIDQSSINERFELIQDNQSKQELMIKGLHTKINELNIENQIDIIEKNRVQFEKKKLEASLHLTDAYLEMLYQNSKE